MSRRLGNNIITAIIAMLLLMTSFALTFTPSSSAQTTVPGFTPMPDRATQTEVAVSPSIIGLGQETLINIMTYPGPSGPTYEAQSLVPELHGGFSNISITIKHPDGTDETFKPIDETLAQVGVEIPGQAQIVGHLQFRYKPTTVGNYTLTASFPGQIYTTAGISSTVKLSAFYKPSQSTVPAKLVVQQEPVLNGLLNGYPWSPLPNEYWENPVSTNNREWYQISGDWVQTGFDSAGSAYNPFSKAPGSAHILWRYQVGDGGLPGGIWGSNPYQAQGTIFGAPIILNGRVYRNGNPGYFECIDLRTGEKLWEAPGSINSAQNLDPEFQTHSQQAEGYIDSWLWGGIGPALFAPGSNTWYRYNPFNGALVQAITNVPTDMTGLKFQDGSPIVFAVQANMSSWNTTKPLKLSSVNLIKWDFSKMITTVGFFNLPSNNWTDGIVWNVTVNTGDQVDIGDNNFRGPNVYPYYGENVVVVKTPNAMQIMAGYDMNTGRMLWKNNATVFDIDVLLQGIATSPSGPLIKQDGSTPNLVAYDVKTGQEIWRAPSGDIPWGLLPSYTYVYNNGTHFAGSFDGHVYAYDSKTGKQVWRSDYVGEEWETIYGNQPLTGYLAAGADGKLYFSSQTVYNMMPRPRFHTLVCVDEATGKFIWKL
ncbi:MAG TPA: PQQ-binding-like beta-propeller repeat protein, partial [Candidatus Sulfotelmatobacter sp.]|nr:PQQ-binding-like beta-propeller repeat protein [Candidatus Sulfotelmatobacter sp.]